MRIPGQAAVTEGHRLLEIRDESSRLLGYLAVDATVNGVCSGGVRAHPSLTPAELAGLARAMTLKYGLVGLPLGGAKAGLLADPEDPAEEKRRAVWAFGRGLRSLPRGVRYLAWTDMGLSARDLEELREASGLSDAFGAADSGRWTGLTVALAAVEAARYLGLEPRGLTAAVEGFGAVGAAAAGFLAAEGVRIVAVSTSRGAVRSERGFSLDELRAARDKAGSGLIDELEAASRIGLGDLLELDVDILIPCARPNAIHAANAGRIAAKIVAPGANLPWTGEAGRILAERGVLAVPDFVANCGGVAGAALDLVFADPRFTEAFLRGRFSALLRSLLEGARRGAEPLEDFAVRLSRERFARMKRNAERFGFLSRTILASGSGGRRGGFIRRAVAPALNSYFERKVLRPVPAGREP